MRAVPVSTCCRAIPHDLTSHKLEPVKSPIVPQCGFRLLPRRAVPASACCRAIPHDLTGHKLEPVKSPIVPQCGFRLLPRRAVPASTCCRAIPHDLTGHKLESVKSPIVLRRQAEPVPLIELGQVSDGAERFRLKAFVPAGDGGVVSSRRCGSLCGFRSKSVVPH